MTKLPFSPRPRYNHDIKFSPGTKYQIQNMVCSPVSSRVIGENPSQRDAGRRLTAASSTTHRLVKTFVFPASPCIERYIFGDGKFHNFFLFLQTARSTSLKVSIPNLTGKCMYQNNFFFLDVLVMFLLWFILVFNDFCIVYLYPFEGNALVFFLQVLLNYKKLSETDWPYSFGPEVSIKYKVNQ